MKNKDYREESENEFEVDEPEELADNSGDDWVPAKTTKRTSTRSRRGAPSKKTKRDNTKGESEEEEDKPMKKGAKSQTSAKSKPKAKGKSKDDDEEEDKELDEEDEEEQLGDEEEEDEEGGEEEEDEEEEEGTINDGNVKTPKEFSSGAFVVLKTDYDKNDEPPIWRIDGKALLQKYLPFKQDGKTLYKNTAMYSGWAISKKDQYYPATIVFKKQSRQEHVVEFRRDSIQK